jgi:hypothetical protein
MTYIIGAARATVEIMPRLAGSLLGVMEQIIVAAAEAKRATAIIISTINISKERLKRLFLLPDLPLR